MTDIHPLARVGKNIFGGMPAPLLLLISMTLTVVLGVDLLVPDVLPLIDEAVLAFLLYGSTSSLLGRRRGAAGPVTEAIPAKRLVKEANAVASDLAARAKALRAGGLPVRELDGLATLSVSTRALGETLRRADAFLSRKENDPWQVEREVERLERAVAEAEAGDERARMESLAVALEGARMHGRSVAQQSADRDKAVVALRGRTGQMRTLLETLRVFDTAGDIPHLPDTLGRGWEPELAAALDGLREMAEATAELDEVAQGTGRRGSGKQRLKQ